MTLHRLDGVLAPAKLNLFLHVVGRRPDGYHLLQSAFVLIDWCDVLHVERNGSGALRRHDLTTPLPSDDLCLRAAGMLQRASGTPLGADIWIDKAIPTGAGMGGGSSDAASTLLALNRLWGLDWPLARLRPLGLALGADVPFFLSGGDAWVEGIGERCTPLALPPASYAVVKPPMSIATDAIFAHPQLPRNTAALILGGCDERAGGSVCVAAEDGEVGRHGGVSAGAQGAVGPGDVAAGLGRNDLQAVAESLCVEVGHAVAWLRHRVGAAATVRMTGSGSAVYARLSPNDMHGSVARAIAEDLPIGWTGRICAGLARHPLAGWARPSRF